MPACGDIQGAGAERGGKGGCAVSAEVGDVPNGSKARVHGEPDFGAFFFFFFFCLSPFRLSFPGMVKGLWLMGMRVLSAQRGDDLE